MPKKQEIIQTAREELAAPVSSSRRWAIVALLFTASLINYLDRATISISLPLIARDLRLGPTQEGILLSAFFWSYASMQVPIGWASDRLNLRWLYGAAFAIWSLGQGLAGLAKSLAFLIMTRIVLGIGESIYLPGGTKIVALLFPPENRGFPSGIFDFGTRCGMALGVIAMPLLLIHFGWRLSFAIIGFIALLWLIPWFATSPTRLKGEQPQKEAASRSDLNNYFNGTEAVPAAPSSPERGSAPLGETRPRSAVGQFEARRLWNRDLIGICLGFFCFDYYWYLLVTWLPDYLVTARHLTVLRAGIYSAAPFLVFGVSEPLGGWIADWLIGLGFDETRTRKGLVTAGLLSGLFLLPAEHVASNSTALLFIMCASLVGLATANLIVIIQCCAPAHQVGLWTGFENLFGNIAGILAPLLTGILISATGSYKPGFDLAVFVLVAGIAFYWLVVGRLSAARV